MIALAGIVLGLGVVLLRLTPLDQNESLLRRSARAHAEERFEDALQLAREVLSRAEPGSLDAARAELLAGWSLARLQRSEEALWHLDRLPDDGTHEGRVALFGRAMRQLKLDRVRRAEESFRAVLQHDPGHPGANRELAKLLPILGRTWASVRFNEFLVRSGEFRADELILIGAPDRYFADDPLLVRQFLLGDPADPGPTLPVARSAIEDNEEATARGMLRRVVDGRPDLLEAVVQYASLVLKRGDLRNAALLANRNWEGDDTHPLMWIVRGRLATSAGDHDLAVECLTEAVARGPAYAEANLNLARALRAAGSSNEASRFTGRLARLNSVNFHLFELTSGYDSAHVERLVAELVSSGRHWEALAWCEIVYRVEEDVPPWAVDTYRRTRRAALDQSGPFVVSPVRISDRNGTGWKPDAPSSRRPIPVRDRVPTATGPPVRFANVASSVGLEFDYRNGTTARRGLEHILQAMGGGTAVLDYDSDGWPDLYLVQACEWPVDGQTKFRNRLFRNIEGKRFEDVTEAAGVGHTGYGQGVAVGDIDNDGDPDLYVCNVGPNVLYRNDGDGTFTDISAVAGVAGNEWTTSAVLCDLDGDALPDLYVVNFLDLDQVLERTCPIGERFRGCPPTMFDEEQDRLFLNRGNGHFEDVTDSAGIRVPGGKGLSVVALDIDGSGRPGLFVGNDTTANFLFRNLTEHAGALRFEEIGVAAGVALDGRGLAQATMGIAADDVDGDGRVDLFVTNFYNDSNTFYRGLGADGFADDTRDVGLRDPGYRMLGFGTEFLDADLDGHPDILVTNGHVDRTFATGVPDRMAPQFYRNAAGRGFVEAPVESDDDYFRGRYLGRSLAVLDWNRDGRPDACVSHIDAPAALLENRTETANGYLAIRLEGRMSSRDAYGATVTVTAGDFARTKQLIAGGGYEVVNECLVHFGLGDVESIDSIRVRWPSGTVDVLHGVEPNQRLEVVEGTHPE